jgi:hypothetical protein
MLSRVGGVRDGGCAADIAHRAGGAKTRAAACPDDPTCRYSYAPECPSVTMGFAMATALPSHQQEGIRATVKGSCDRRGLVRRP